MAQNLLASLAVSGIVRRRARGQLAVSPRFLAHAEGTAGRLTGLYGVTDPTDILAQALRTWDDFHHDAHQGAHFLHALLADRDQLGALRPVFPALEQFAVAA